VTAKFDRSKKEINPLCIDKELKVENYALNFNNEIGQVNKPSLLSKLTLVLFSVIIITTPLHEFIETLRPSGYIYFGMCLPF
jgi:hypothetical protein